MDINHSSDPKKILSLIKSLSLVEDDNDLFNFLLTTLNDFIDTKSLSDEEKACKLAETVQKKLEVFRIKV